MKTNQFANWAQMRSANLSIGFAAALLIVISAFNWTTERGIPSPLYATDYQPIAELEVVRTAQPAPPSKPPAPVLKPTDIILEVPDVVVPTNPILIAEPTPTLGEPTAGINNTYFSEPVKPNPLPLPVEEDPAANAPFIIVEDMPRFPGCEDEIATKAEKKACAEAKLLAFLGNNLRWPALARDMGLEGMVVVRFVVERDGSVTNIQIMRDIGGGCGQEAVRVVGLMPRWVPGKQQGRTVRVQYNLPVRFKLY